VFPPGAVSERFEGDQGTWFSVVPGVEPISSEGEALVADLRDVEGPVDLLVGGGSAALVDSKAAIIDRLPAAAAIVVLATFVLLFLAFGSIVVPLKAILLNILSLTATFGAMVWIFQEGHGAGLLDFTPVGALDTSTPILMFCIAFGLSMDYEVFLLSRIKEEHDRTGDNTRSVAAGLEKTGRLVTAASGLLAITFVAFSTSGISFIKLFGVGLAVAVVMDATVVRGLLVPAFMRLAGELNWWAPAPLRRLHARIGLSESDPGGDEPPSGAPPSPELVGVAGRR
jgi:RND superfamily putative drug exporter